MKYSSHAQWIEGATHNSLNMRHADFFRLIKTFIMSLDALHNEIQKENLPTIPHNNPLFHSSSEEDVASSSRAGDFRTPSSSPEKKKDKGVQLEQFSLTIDPEPSPTFSSSRRMFTASTGSSGSVDVFMSPTHQPLLRSKKKPLPPRDDDLLK